MFYSIKDRQYRIPANIREGDVFSIGPSPQRYTCVTAKLTRNGIDTLEVQSNCTECGAEFRFTTGYDCVGINRNCSEHRRARRLKGVGVDGVAVVKPEPAKGVVPKTSSKKLWNGLTDEELDVWPGDRDEAYKTQWLTAIRLAYEAEVDMTDPKERELAKSLIDDCVGRLQHEYSSAKRDNLI